MSMELEGQRYSGKALLDKMEALVREGYYGSDGSKKTTEETYFGTCGQASVHPCLVKMI